MESQAQIGNSVIYQSDHIEDPLVSVVLPTKSCEKFLEYSLDSILNQSYKNLEIIVVLDNANKATVEIVASKTDHRLIKLFAPIGGRGLPFCLNYGISRATGKYLCRMDCDDISRKDRIEKQVSFLEKHQHIDVVGSQAFLLCENGRQIGLKRKPMTEWGIDLYMKFATPFIHPSVMFRSSLVTDFSFYPNWPRGQDYVLFSKLFKKGARYRNLNNKLLFYRVVESSNKNISDYSSFFCKKFNRGLSVEIPEWNANIDGDILIENRFFLLFDKWIARLIIALDYGLQAIQKFLRI